MLHWFKTFLYFTTYLQLETVFGLTFHKDQNVCVCTVTANSHYPRHSHSVSGHAAVTEVRGQVTLHCARDSSRLPLLSADQLLHPEVEQKKEFINGSEIHHFIFGQDMSFKARPSCSEATCSHRYINIIPALKFFLSHKILSFSLNTTYSLDDLPVYSLCERRTADGDK